jgi:Putative peptidoglycan binding domain
MTLGDGHDLKSDRFSRLLDLEADFDNESMSKAGSQGRSVQAIQQALYDAGHSLPAFGADGDYGAETTAAVENYQTAHPPLTVDGKVGFGTMGKLDAQFPNPALPGAAEMAAAWTIPMVRNIVRPWSPRTIDVLATRITLKSFDSITFADERWDGAAWVPAPFIAGGFNTGVEIGVVNTTNARMAETLYHEVLHAEQPTSHGTTLARESYAYRIGEEFSIALGLTGRPALRSTDAQGREFADRTKVGAFVSAKYPSVAAGTGEQIIGKGAGAGTVRVQRTDGSIFTRPAAVGEKVPGPKTITGEKTHAKTDWTAP